MWEINLGNQSISLLLSVGLGAVLCAYYDFFRALRKSGCDSFIDVFICDIFYAVTSAFITFIFLLSRTNGTLRAFVLFGIIIGFFISRLVFSRFLLWFFEKTVFVLRRILQFLRHIFNIILRFFEKIEVFCEKPIKKGLKTLKKLLKKLYQLLYTKKQITDKGKRDDSSYGE